MLACVSLVWAQAAVRPNFSGTWRLNAAKSDFGAMPAPASRSDRITQKGSSLRDAYTQSGQRGEISADMKYSIGGPETGNELSGSPIRSRARWEGGDLVIDNQTSINGNTITFQERWSLSPNGHTLTIRRHSDTPLGKTDQRIVLEKQ